jgi:hypothetical protein
MFSPAKSLCQNTGATILVHLPNRIAETPNGIRFAKSNLRIKTPNRICFAKSNCRIELPEAIWLTNLSNRIAKWIWQFDLPNGIAKSNRQIELPNHLIANKVTPTQLVVTSISIVKTSFHPIVSFTVPGHLS